MSSLILAAFLFGPAAFALKPGDTVPDVMAKNQKGENVTLSKFRKKFVLIYFYPKDDTPGCTVEAQTLQANFEKFENLNAVILGVSRQGEKSHQEFKSKHGLQFDLLVDEDGKFGKALGVGTMPVVGWSKRQSLLIGPDGKVIKIYDSVNPKEHAAEVLKDIQSTKTNS
jgi:peroxiredoxin Q/BCP